MENGGSMRRSQTLLAPPQEGPQSCCKTLTWATQGGLDSRYLVVLFALRLVLSDQYTTVMYDCLSGISAFMKIAGCVMLFSNPRLFLFAVATTMVFIPLAWIRQLGFMMMQPFFVIYELWSRLPEHQLPPSLHSWTGWRALLIGLSVDYMFGQFIRLSPRMQLIPNFFDRSALGTATRTMFLFVMCCVFAIPFMMTSRTMVRFYGFLANPWHQLLNGFQDEPDMQFAAIDVLTMLLSAYRLFAWGVYLVVKRQQRQAATMRSDDLLQWVLRHPFHVELEQGFGSGGSILQRTGVALSRSVSTLYNSEPDRELPKKQGQLITARRQQAKDDMQLIPQTVLASIRRDRLWEDSRQFLMSKGPSELLANHFKVGFANEPGLDYGGVARDWFDSVAKLLSENLEDPGSMLVAAPDQTLMPRPVASCVGLSETEQQERLKDLIAFGRFMAFAILRKQTLPMALSRVACRMLLQMPMRESDVQQLDPEFYRNRVHAVKTRLSELNEALGEPLTFMSAPTPFKAEPEELKPGGAEILVTEENKQEYTQLLCEAYLCGAVRREIQCMLQGFWELLPPALLRDHVDPRELSLVISGVPALDTSIWKTHASSNGDALIIKWFWEVVHEMIPEDRGKLLHFTTGSSRLPPGGFPDLNPKFQVEVSGGEPDHLPTSHTCFNQLILPKYGSKEVLREKILMAVKSGEGFGFV